MMHAVFGGSRSAPQAASGIPAPDRWIASITPGTGLNEGGAMEMTEGEVCPDETKSIPIAPLQAVRPPNSTPYLQESGSWFPDPACSAIIRPSLRSQLRNVG
jgi:hypothetical protein